MNTLTVSCTVYIFIPTLSHLPGWESYNIMKLVATYAINIKNSEAYT